MHNAIVYSAEPSSTKLDVPVLEREEYETIKFLWSQEIRIKVR
jgi:hypothetical protein